jgi:hypothetical protein
MPTVKLAAEPFDLRIGTAPTTRQHQPDGAQNESSLGRSSCAAVALGMDQVPSVEPDNAGLIGRYKRALARTQQLELTPAIGGDARPTAVLVT